MKFAEITGWVEEHPTESIVIGAGGLIAILWLLGYFSGSGSSASGASNLASAYYAAEAQQAVVGGQIQMATIQSAAQTAQTADQANAAVAINAAQTGAATTINGQNASASTTINGQNVAGANAQTWLGGNIAILQSNDQLQATYSNNATALATAQSNNATALATAQTNNSASLMHDVLGTVIPAEVASGTPNFQFNLPSWLGGGATGYQTSPVSIAALENQYGYPPAAVTKTTGLPA